MRRSTAIVVALLVCCASAAGAQQPFTHELVTLTLPKGWIVQPAADVTDPDFIASFSFPAKGASAVVSGLASYGSLEEVMQHGREVVQAALPGAIPDSMIYPLQTAGGDKMLLQGFSGTLNYAGKDVELAVLMAATVNGRRGLLLQVYFAPRNASPVGKDFGALIRSIN